MSERPGFLREFSKETNPEDRDRLASEVRALRKQKMVGKKRTVEKQNARRLEQAQLEERLAEKHQELVALRDRLDEINGNLVNRIRYYFEARKISAEEKVGRHAYDELVTLRDRSEQREQAEIEADRGNDTPESEQIKNLFDSFYYRLETSWTLKDYGPMGTPEEAKKYLTEDRLSKASMAEYVMLLKRFPSEMVTHVTRQGIRDHSSMMEHSAGMSEYNDSFRQMVRDGRLRSPLGVAITVEARQQAMAEFLNLAECESKAKAIADLELFLDPNDPMKPDGWSGYGDRMSVHMAAEEVADSYYGAERMNEIFVTYPAAFIGTHYGISGRHGPFGDIRGSYNDVWIWANEERGIDLQAGVVFIPAETPVDATTGSRYELDEQQRARPNTELISKLDVISTSAEFGSIRPKVRTMLEDSSRLRVQIEAHPYDAELREKLSELTAQLKTVKAQVAERFSITDHRVVELLFDPAVIFSLPPEQVRDSLRSTTSWHGLEYVESSTTIPAQEYWEAYFQKHPDQRPSKIVYYRGGDPTQAVEDWRRENGLKKSIDPEDRPKWQTADFPSDQEVQTSSRRFESIARQTIERYYSSADQEQVTTSS